MINKKIIKLAITFFFLFSFLLQTTGQIYNKRIIYKFQYTVVKDKTELKGDIYLGCFAEEFRSPSEKQYSVIWTTKWEILKEHIHSTGIIENNERIWLHPPRFEKFSILEYSPFPQIKYPIEVGNSWNWKLTPGSNWTSRQYNIDENDMLKYHFVISEKVEKLLFNSNRKEVCYLVIGKSVGSDLSSEFRGLFNEDFGFVNFEFRNIDGSIIVLTLAETLNWSDINQNFRIPAFAY